MKLKLKDILTIDFETFYSKDYSLTKKQYNTSSYIRDPQFKIHCLGIKDGTKPTVWYEGKDSKKALIKYGAKSRPVMAHNMSFDGFIMADRLGIVAPYYLCTLSMARGLHGTLTRNDLDTVSKLYGRKGKHKPAALKKVKGLRDLPEDLLIDLAEYMCGDVDECYAIGKTQLKVYPEKELNFIDWVIRQFCDPVLQIDAQLVREELDDEITGKAAKQRAANVAPEVLQSADAFAAALEVLGVDPPLKVSPSDPNKLTYAFAKNDLAFQDLLGHEDDRVVALVEARLATKSTIGETRARRMLELVGKPVPVGYNYSGAHTHRLSGANKLNFQNLQRQAYLPDGSLDLTTGRLRRSILAPKGHVLSVRDSSQIEARFSFWFSDQLDMVEAFRIADEGLGPDVYRVMAAMIYQIPVEQITKQQRFVGKVAVLGLGYGMGWKKFKHTLESGAMGPPVQISDQEAKRVVRMYRAANSKIVEMWEFCEHILAEMIAGREGTYKCIEWDEQTIWMPNGLGLHYYGLNAQYNPERAKFEDFKFRMRGKYISTWGGTILENLTQALCRIIVVDQLLEINQKYRCVMMTHDENVALAKLREAEACQKFMAKVMKTAPAWAPGLVLNSEGGFDVRYSK